MRAEAHNSHAIYVVGILSRFPSCRFFMTVCSRYLQVCNDSLYYIKYYHNHQPQVETQIYQWREYHYHHILASSACQHINHAPPQHAFHTENNNCWMIGPMQILYIDPYPNGLIDILVSCGNSPEHLSQGQSNLNYTVPNMVIHQH